MHVHMFSLDDSHRARCSVSAVSTPLPSRSSSQSYSNLYPRSNPMSPTLLSPSVSRIFTSRSATTVCRSYSRYDQRYCYRLRYRSGDAPGSYSSCVFGLRLVRVVLRTSIVFVFSIMGYFCMINFAYLSPPFGPLLALPSPSARTVTTKEDTTRFGLARVLGWDSLDMGCGTCAWFVRVGGVWGVGCLRGGVGLQSHPWGCSLHRLLPACACMCFMDVCAWVCGSMCVWGLCVFGVVFDVASGERAALRHQLGLTYSVVRCPLVPCLDLGCCCSRP